MGVYYNTLNHSGQELIDLVSKAKKQDKNILSIFAYSKKEALGVSDILFHEWKMKPQPVIKRRTKKAFNQQVRTVGSFKSVGRALNSLLKSGLIEPFSTQLGAFGHRETTYKLCDGLTSDMIKERLMEEAADSIPGLLSSCE